MNPHHSNTDRGGWTVFTGLCLLLLAALLSSLPAAAQSTHTIDSTASRIDILTDSAGMFSRLGHRHVISARNISGVVELEQASPIARLEFAVADMVVDDPAARQAAGDGFESQPSEKDIAGTRRNMLGRELLDAERFPVIRLEIAAPSPASGDTSFEVVIHLRDRAVERNLPGTLAVDGERLVVKAEFIIEHEALGLKPFTALGGTMRVASPLDFRIHIEAIADTDTALVAPGITENRIH